MLIVRALAAYACSRSDYACWGEFLKSGDHSPPVTGQRWNNVAAYQGIKAYIFSDESLWACSI